MNSTSRFPKLFITDLDDTALGGGFKPYSRFPDIFSGFLDKLEQHDCKWATNTTWDVNSQVQMILGSRVASRPAYLVGGKGLQLCSLREDEPVNIQPYADGMNIRLEEVCGQYLRPLIKEVCSTFELKNISFNGFWFSAAATDKDGAALLSFIKEREKVLEQLSFMVFPQKNQFSAHPAFLKKSAAVREILKIANMEPHDIAVAGDGLIDLDMMACDLAGYVLCPGNAHPDVKAWVAKRNGVIGKSGCGPGVVEAFDTLAVQNGWEW